MKRKVVTLCGSMQFQDKIYETAERLELECGYVVIGVIPHVLPGELTAGQMALLNELHRSKIDLADAVFVVNANGYIGESVRSEIEYARSLGKEIMYLEKINAD